MPDQFHSHAIAAFRIHHSWYVTVFAQVAPMSSLYIYCFPCCFVVIRTWWSALNSAEIHLITLWLPVRIPLKLEIVQIPLRQLPQREERPYDIVVIEICRVEEVERKDNFVARCRMSDFIETPLARSWTRINAKHFDASVQLSTSVAQILCSTDKFSFWLVQLQSRLLRNWNERSVGVAVSPLYYNQKGLLQ